MGFQFNFCFSLLLLHVFTTNSIPIYADEIIQKQFSEIREAAKAHDFPRLLTLVSRSVFELEDGEQVRKALQNTNILILSAKFRNPGIIATVLNDGIYLSNVTLSRDQDSSTGWILLRAGFLECLLNNDADSYCIED